MTAGNAFVLINDPPAGAPGRIGAVGRWDLPMDGSAAGREVGKPRLSYSAGMVTREELYALVWSQPMTKVCEQFGVSSSYMARLCTLLNVPRPPRGHWQKLAVRKGGAPRTPPRGAPW